MTGWDFENKLVEAECIMEMTHKPFEQYSDHVQRVFLAMMLHTDLIRGVLHMTGQEIMRLWDDETERQLEKRLLKKARGRATITRRYRYTP